MIDTCVCCGNYVPEGMMVCPYCESRVYDSDGNKFKRLTYKSRFGGYGLNIKFKKTIDGLFALRDALGKYEDLGYTPEQLKKIIDERRV